MRWVCTPLLEIYSKKIIWNMDANLCTKMFIVEFLSVMKIVVNIRRMSIWWNTRKTFKIMFMNNLNYIENNYKTQINEKSSMPNYRYSIITVNLCRKTSWKGKMEMSLLFASERWNYSFPVSLLFFILCKISKSVLLM